jgi:magnesium transporter
MVHQYAIERGRLQPVALHESAPVVFYINPNETEKTSIIKNHRISRFDIDSALDPDEVSRLEVNQDNLFIIWKTVAFTRLSSTNQDQSLQVSPSGSVGMMLSKDLLVLIMREKHFNYDDERLSGMRNVADVLLSYLSLTTHSALLDLKRVKHYTDRLTTLLKRSTGNRYLLQMFGLSENLIYCIHALEGNMAVLSKLYELRETFQTSSAMPEVIGSLNKEVVRDVLSENEQCTKQANIYDKLLSGLMDARGNVINNNMNELLKDLTIINVVFLPLNLVTGALGMSELTVFAEKYGWNLEIAYLAFFVIMVVAAVGTNMFLRLYVNRPNTHF